MGFEMYLPRLSQHCLGTDFQVRCLIDPADALKSVIYNADNISAISAA